MTDKNFTTIDNEYLNTGGGCMVDITTVYDQLHSRILWVYINEEWLTVSTYDYIRNELPADIEADYFIQYSVEESNFTSEPSFDNHQMNNLPEDIACLLFDCMLTYIRNKAKYMNKPLRLAADKLPNELALKLTVDYKTWLNEHEELVETDGYKIIVSDKYLKESTNNGRIAVSMLKDLKSWLPPTDIDGEQELWDKFYDQKIFIIFNKKTYIFDNGADIYNALESFTKNVIDEQ